MRDAMSVVVYTRWTTSDLPMMATATTTMAMRNQRTWPTTSSLNTGIDELS